MVILTQQLAVWGPAPRQEGFNPFPAQRAPAGVTAGNRRGLGLRGLVADEVRCREVAWGRGGEAT